MKILKYLFFRLRYAFVDKSEMLWIIRTEGHTYGCERTLAMEHRYFDVPLATGLYELEELD
jgi:hypothetical protein